MSRSTPSLVLFALLLLCALPAFAASDWPQWRGQARDGHAAGSGLLTAWPADGPPLAWRAKGLGGGYSSLAVVGDAIYTMGDLSDGQYVIAVKRADGAALWKTKVGPTWNDQYLGPRATPTVDGDHLYVISTEGDVYCLESATGKEAWKKNLPATYKAELMKAKGTYDWKFSESPLVDGEHLIVTPGTRQAAMVALNKKTGAEIWRTAIPELGERGADGAAYSSAVISEAGGVRQYVNLIGRGVIGVEASSGRYLWGYNRVANGIANIPTPIVDGNDVFVSTGYGTGAALLELSRKGDGVEAKEVYFLEADTMQNHHGGMILHDGTIYTGTAHNKGFPLAVTMKTGKVAWGPVRNKGTGSAAVAMADGHLYFRYQNGMMVLFEATPEAYKEKGAFMIPDVEKESWSHPVIVDGMLYLREQDNLFAYDVRAK